MNVLIVVLEEFVLNNIRIILNGREDDVNYYFAGSYIEAVEMIDDIKIDILVTDMYLGNYSGLELILYTRLMYDDVKKIIIADDSSINDLLAVINLEGVSKIVKKPLLRVLDLINHLDDLILDENNRKQRLNKNKEKKDVALMYSDLLDKSQKMVKGQDKYLEGLKRIGKTLLESNIRKKDMYLYDDKNLLYKEFLEKILDIYFKVYFELEEEFSSFVKRLESEYRVEFEMAMAKNSLMNLPTQTVLKIQFFIELLQTFYIQESENIRIKATVERVEKNTYLEMKFWFDGLKSMDSIINNINFEMLHIVMKHEAVSANYEVKGTFLQFIICI